MKCENEEENGETYHTLGIKSDTTSVPLNNRCNRVKFKIKKSGLIFFGPLISESGWVGSLSDQLVVGRVRSGRVT